MIINVAGGLHINGMIDATSQHPGDWASPTAHGYAANANLPACKVCHGTILTGGTSSVSCSSCHATGWSTNCTFCHGSTSTGQSAPPVNTQGKSSTAEITIGAHNSHLQATHNISSKIACNECHLVPVNEPTLNHMDITPAEIIFGGLSKMNLSNPRWTRASATCSSTYCHGSTLTGGTRTTPTWTAVNGTQITCTSCHGIPPNTGRHNKHVGERIACSSCHSGYTSTSVSAATHINGIKNVSLSTWNSSTRVCSKTCHKSQKWP